MEALIGRSAYTTSRLVAFFCNPPEVGHAAFSIRFRDGNDERTSLDQSDEAFWVRMHGVKAGWGGRRNDENSLDDNESILETYVHAKAPDILLRM